LLLHEVIRDDKVTHNGEVFRDILAVEKRRTRSVLCDIMKILEDQNNHKDNTVGSRSKINLAYIAGFLDGDGSLMLQIKKRKDSKIGTRFMSTVCFYQDTRHEEPLKWIKEILGIGYLSRRNDGMTELRINGFKQIREILINLIPYLRFKKVQARALCEASEILAQRKYKKKGEAELRRLVDLILEIQNQNYVAKRKKTKEELLNVLGLTP